MRSFLLKMLLMAAVVPVCFDSSPAVARTLDFRILNQRLSTEPGWVDGIIVHYLSSYDPDFRRDLYNSKVLDHHSVALLPKTSAWLAKNYFEKGGVVGGTYANTGRKGLFYQVFTLNSLRRYPAEWLALEGQVPQLISHGVALLKAVDRPYVTDAQLLKRISQCELMLL